MNINRANYDIYIIDYYDGKLTPVESAELLYFISQHPDLEEEFNSFENFTLPADESKYRLQENLKKDFRDISTITDSNFEEFCIAYSENDLDEDSGKKLFEYLKKNPEKKKDFEGYQKLKLTADETLQFPDKTILKKPQTRILGLRRPLIYTAAAAAVILILMVINYSRNTKNIEFTSSSDIQNIPVDTSKTISFQAPVAENKPMPNLTKKKVVNEKSHKTTALASSNDEDKPVKAKRNGLSYIALNPIQISHINCTQNPTGLTPTIKTLPVSKEVTTSGTGENSLAAFLMKKVASFETATSRENLNIWTLAEAGVRGINILTESDVQLERTLNAKGKISSFAIESETFSFTTPINK